MGLDLYRKKRNFNVTPEPPPKEEKSKGGFTFCVQKHDATRLHYDFRLELDGVLKSWAVTRGPSLDPADKRLAVRTEDHPLSYGDFEGTIPKGEYGGGTVMLWDRGNWTPLDNNPAAALKKGHLSFELQGERLKGRWTLVRMRGRENEKRENWLLIKEGGREKLTGRKATAFLDNNAFSIKTGRTMEEIADAPASAAKKKTKPEAAAKKKKGATGKTSIKALRDKYPGVQLATLVEAPPSSGDWVHEMKYDGYRIICYVAQGKVAIYTRNGNEWTDRFPAVAAALAKLKVKSAVLDGEAVVISPKGVTSFYSLQEALGEGGDVNEIQAYFFDILHLNGKDIASAPLRERKETLRMTLGRAKPPLHYSDHLEDQPGLLAHACRQGLEGLISKRADARYAEGRSKAWVKSKCNKRQEFIILGFTAPKRGSRAIGALHIGYMAGKTLKYAGKVGTGFDMATAQQLFTRLSPHAVDEAPVKKLPTVAARGTTWVKPKLLCEVTFTEWTPAGLVRHPSFDGLREDKKPSAVKREKAVKTVSAKPKRARSSKKTKAVKRDATIKGIEITHPERKVFADSDLTKRDLAEYYATLAPLILREIKGRPLSLMRCPAGARQECFFQRNPDAHMKKYVQAFTHKQKGVNHEYLAIDDAKGLIFLIQMGAIELHPWGATVADVQHPTRMVFDLDPDTGVPFEAVKMATRDVRKRLQDVGLKSFVKTTGGKGLHVIVPLGGKQTWEEVKSFAADFAQGMAAAVPEAYVATMSKAKRKGKIFIDFFRNDVTSTAIADYSVRARAGAPVAVPLDWKELTKLKAANAYDVKAVLLRVKKGKVFKIPHLHQKVPV